MAHFAKLGPGDIVERVEVVNNDIATTEQAGADFLNNLYNTRDVWKQTSYNTRGNVHSNGGTPLEKIMQELVLHMIHKEMHLYHQNHVLIVGL